MIPGRPADQRYVARMAPSDPTGTTVAGARAPADARVRPRPRRAPPTLRVERGMLRSGAGLVAGMDEVGRGSPAGPVHVGVVVVDAATGPAPVGLRDSKLLTPAAREALAPRLRAWAAGCAVGWAGADEVDRFGVVGALRLAGLRALDLLDCPPGAVLLDGDHDWLSPVPDGRAALDGPGDPGTAVVTRVRADMVCSSVAAASVLAKVARDAVMSALAEVHPGYGWEANKGYGTAGHLEAIARLGPTPHHRLSWRLPGQG